MKGKLGFSLTRKALEVLMAPQWNEIEYTKDFDGNLHGKIEPVPARVNITLRTMTPETAREVRMYRFSYSVPLYAFQSGKELPMPPSLEATGRHYFKW
jgi:hypothetical protein